MRYNNVEGSEIVILLVRDGTSIKSATRNYEERRQQKYSRGKIERSKKFPSYFLIGNGFFAFFK